MRVWRGASASHPGAIRRASSFVGKTDSAEKPPIFLTNIPLTIPVVLLRLLFDSRSLTAKNTFRS
jgi:hypothetical protein